MGERPPGTLCVTKLGRDWIDEGTLCRTRSTPSKPAAEQKPKANKLCNNLSAVQFVRRFQSDCELIAKDLDMPVENILGLVAQESEWGRGRIASEYNNYFSMHAPAIYEISETPARRDPSVKVAVFESFIQCGKSFVFRYGKAVKGISDPKAFGDALVKAGFNPGNAAKGGRENFPDYLAGRIKEAKERMACPVK